MSEYIKRKAAINKVNEIPAHFNSGDIRYGIEIAIQAIKDTPTADVVEVMRGEWIYVDGDVGYNVYRCSKCGEVISLDEEKIYNYCPNCGAKMGGERKDEEGPLKKLYSSCRSSTKKQNN